MANGTHAATVAEANALAEQAYCWQAHLAGKDVRTIAREASAHFGKSLSYSTVWRRIDAERVALRAEIRQSAEEARDVALARLDRLQLATEALLAACVRDDPHTGLPVYNHAAASAHTATLLRIEQQRAKLQGLEVVQVEVSGTVQHVDAADVELARLLDHVPAARVGSDA